DAVLVYGASGGVGTALLDLSRHLGLEVAAVAARRWHGGLREEAALLVDESDPSADETLRRFRPSGVDAAFDAVGGTHIWRTKSYVSKRGHVVAYGVASAVKPGGRRDLMAVARLAMLLGASRIRPRPRVTLYAMDQRVKVDALRCGIDDDLRTLV